MKKLILSTAVIAAAGAGFSSSASAALADGDTLNFDPGVTGGYYGFVTGGSYFAMDTDGSGSFTKSERTPISQNNGLILGSTQTVSGAHTGAPDGSESPDIDQPWNFFGNTGMHQTTSPTNVTSTSASGATIDMSGWNVSWGDVPSIPMGEGTSAGVGTIVCAVDCSDGDTYSMDYFATVPPGDPSGFGNVAYQLHLEGTITAGTGVVPIPAAVWLFGSGLLGLVGVARRRKGA